MNEELHGTHVFFNSAFGYFQKINRFDIILKNKLVK